MEQDVKERFNEHHDFIVSRASKDEVKVLRGLVILVIVTLLGAGGLGAWINSGTSERLSVIETKIGGFTERQKENNALLNEIERLLRTGVSQDNR